MAGQISGWKQKIVAFAGALGAPGLFFISFLDSSFFTFPIMNDLLLIELCIQRPSRMPLYALMAASGSAIGCAVLYFVARKGGEAFFRRRAGSRAEAIRDWVEKNGFIGMFLTAMLPPPTPFKIFVLAGAVFEVPFWSFTSAIALARMIRYFGMGYLAIRYGNDALPFLRDHTLEATVIIVLFVAFSYLISRSILSRKPPAEGASS